MRVTRLSSRIEDVRGFKRIHDAASSSPSRFSQWSQQEVASFAQMERLRQPELLVALKSLPTVVVDLGELFGAI